MVSEQGLGELLEAAGFRMSERQLEQLENYRLQLQEVGRSFNLTAILQTAEIWRKHFLDSLLLARMLPGSPGFDLVDVGSGAGLPGLPLKIWRSDLRLTLLEASGKKAGFLRQVAEGLRLEEVRVLAMRAEEAGQDPSLREKFDVAVSRAVAPLNVLAEYCMPLLRVGGRFIAAKGPRVDEELQDGERVIRLLGGGEMRVERLALPGAGEDRRLVLAEKAAHTPGEYPRRPGRPVQKPL